MEVRGGGRTKSRAESSGDFAGRSGKPAVVVDNKEEVIVRVGLFEEMIAELLVGKRIVLYLHLDSAEEDGGGRSSDHRALFR